MRTYFKRPNGEVFAHVPGKMMKVEDLKKKFVECDEDGNEIKVAKKKAKKVKVEDAE